MNDLLPPSFQKPPPRNNGRGTCASLLGYEIIDPGPCAKIRAEPHDSSRVDKFRHPALRVVRISKDCSACRAYLGTGRHKAVCGLVPIVILRSSVSTEGALSHHAMRYLPHVWITISLFLFFLVILTCTIRTGIHTVLATYAFVVVDLHGSIARIMSGAYGAYLYTRCILAHHTRSWNNIHLDIRVLTFFESYNPPP